MKYAHILLMILLIAAMILSLQGCGVVEARESDNDPFDVIYHGNNYKVVRHDGTGVLYAVSNGAYSRGTFTMLVDADGKPLVYKEAA